MPMIKTFELGNMPFIGSKPLVRNGKMLTPDECPAGHVITYDSNTGEVLSIEAPKDPRQTTVKAGKL